MRLRRTRAQLANRHRRRQSEIRAPPRTAATCHNSQRRIGDACSRPPKRIMSPRRRGARRFRSGQLSAANECRWLYDRALRSSLYDPSSARTRRMKADGRSRAEHDRHDAAPGFLPARRRGDGAGGRRIRARIKRAARGCTIRGSGMARPAEGTPPSKVASAAAKARGTALHPVRRGERMCSKGVDAGPSRATAAAARRSACPQPQNPSR